MKMETNLQGRLRNTSLPYNHGLLPLFEAVINSIHAIEDAGLSSEEGNITVEVVRDPHQTFGFDKKRGPDPTRDIIGFKVTDNGIGFTDANMKSFLTLDSDYKKDRGGRGVGRLLWLKAFKRVTIRSIFYDSSNALKLRTFTFTATSGVSNEKCEDAPQETKRSTTVHLDGFIDRYRYTSLRTTQAIAKNLFEHCLWYFVREEGAPKIIVKDNDEYIDLNNIYEEHMVSSAETEPIEIKGELFDLIHIKLRSNSSNSHIVAFCAAKRLVKEENLTGKIPGLYGKLSDENGEFVYACYVTSPFLDETVRSERTDFDIVEDTGELFAQTEISFSEIRKAIIEKISVHLSKYLIENREKAKERIEKFVSYRSPRYRPILGRIPQEKLYNIDPNISDKELELTLYKHLTEIEEEMLAEGHEVINFKEGEDLFEYKKRLQEYLRKAEDIKKSDLANYVSHRRVVLELLEKAIQKGPDGRYAREDLIHSLIMPMHADSNEVVPDSCNLWLVDERLAFHDYMASDKPLSVIPITNSNEKKRPDIISLNIFDIPILVSERNSLPLASIVVIEIKRPMRNDAATGEEKDPIEQVLGYLDRIRKGKVKTAKGRRIPKSENIPGYCYVICDITPSIEERCKMHDAIITSDGLGYFFYKRSYNAYVEIISFDRLVKAAKERNKAFFDKLGLPTT